MKKIGASDIIGERGIAHIRKVVLAMGFMFYETGGVEAGIDGFIELRDEATGAVGNLLLQVQGKATQKLRLQGETETSFEFPCQDADIAYWLQGTAPVLLIIVRPELEKAYWKSIKDWFADPEHLKSRKVIFDKKRDEFTRNAKAGVIAVAAAASPGSSGPSVRKREEMLINLLGVDFAPTLYWAPTDHATDKSFGSALRELHPGAGSEWIVRGKAVLSFHRLDQEPWSELCEWQAMEEFGTDEWAYSDDDDRQRDFVALLNRGLGEFVRPKLWHDRDDEVFFFRKIRNKDNLNFSYRSLRNTTTRRVVGRYGKLKSDPTQPSYWRHSAFSGRFVRLGGKWFVGITPTYYFTKDGIDKDNWSSERLKKIKEMENNAAVLGQFVMWRDFFITHRVGGDLYVERYPFLSFNEVPSLSLEVGVPDELWKSQEADPASPLFDYALTEAQE